MSLCALDFTGPGARRSRSKRKEMMLMPKTNAAYRVIISAIAA